MISPEYARSQIERLSGLKKYPKKTVAALELAKALEAAATEAAAEQYITDCVGNQRVCPTPADIRAYFRGPMTSPAVADCPRCHGTGWRSVTRKDAHGNLVDASAPCRCGTE